MLCKLFIAEDIVAQWAVIKDEMDCIRAMFRRVFIVVYKIWAYIVWKNNVNHNYYSFALFYVPGSGVVLLA